MTLLFSFSFNHTFIFCINTHALVLINQYSTGLFVSYSIWEKPNCMKLFFRVRLPDCWLALPVLIAPSWPWRKFATETASLELTNWSLFWCHSHKTFLLRQRWFLQNKRVDLLLARFWKQKPGNTKGESITVPLSCMTTDNFCFYLQNRLIQTSQTGGQR
jgi:hypothetical protein